MASCAARRKLANAMRLATAFVCVLGLTACPTQKPRAPFKPQPPVTHSSGLITQVLSRGEGDEAKQGDKVTVHYVGTLVDGTTFDSSRERDQPFSFWVGKGMVIDGWDEGLLGMREGEVRKLTVPAPLGYGTQAKKGIPPNSTLVFEVELLDLK